MEKETQQLISKQFVAETKADAAERTVTAIISTSSIDRDKEILVPKGADFSNYLKNPVVMWAHNYFGQPIGRAMWIKRRGNTIVAKVEFANTEQADEVYELFKGGFLSAFSVGFRVLEAREPTDEDIKANPEWKGARRIFLKWELLEFSVVAVPANPEALVQAVKSQEIQLCDITQKLLDVEIEDDDACEIFLPEKWNTNMNIYECDDSCDITGVEGLKPHPNEDARRLKIQVEHVRIAVEALPQRLSVERVQVAIGPKKAAQMLQDTIKQRTGQVM